MKFRKFLSVVGVLCMSLPVWSSTHKAGNESQKQSSFIINAEKTKIAAEMAVKIFTSRRDILPVTLGLFLVRGLSMSMSASANLLNPIAVERAAAKASTIQIKREGVIEYPFI